MKAMRILWPWFLLVADASDAGIPACAVKGVSFSDPTVQTLNGGQPMDAITCQKACAFTASCAHFTYYTDSKGCWLLTAAAQLNEKGDDAFRPSEIYAISGPKECPPAQIKKKNVTDDVHPDAEGHYTVAPGVEISPTGPRPVVPFLGSSFNETLWVNKSGWEVPYTGGMRVPEKILGVSWYWCLAAVAVVAFACCCAMCCCCCQSSPRRRKRAIEAEITRSKDEDEPLVKRPMKDAGLFRPQLHVPQLPLPQLVTPQLVSMPAEANVRSMELHVSPIISPRASPRGSPARFVRTLAAP